MNEGFTNTRFEQLFERAVIRNFEDMLDAIPQREELEKIYTFSERHNARMEKLFKKVRRGDILRITALWTRRIAAAVMIAATIFFGALLALSSNVRAAVSDVIIQWFEGFTRFTSDDNSGIDVEPRDWRPQYLPDGFTESDFLVVGNITRIVYKNADEIEIYLTIAPDSSMLSVDNDDTVYRSIIINGTEYHLFKSLSDVNPSNVIWHKDGFRFVIFSDLSIGELQAIALSVIY